MILAAANNQLLAEQRLASHLWCSWSPDHLGNNITVGFVWCVTEPQTCLCPVGRRSAASCHVTCKIPAGEESRTCRLETLKGGQTEQVSGAWQPNFTAPTFNSSAVLPGRAAEAPTPFLHLHPHPPRQEHDSACVGTVRPAGPPSGSSSSSTAHL